MDSSIKILVEKNCETEESIEQNVVKVFDEFAELFKNEAEQSSESRGNRKFLQVISAFHEYCNKCYDHIYLYADFSDINSFFENHINTNYHKSLNIFNNFKKDEPVIKWEEIGITGFCKVCEISGLHATVFESRQTSLNHRSHKCKNKKDEKEFFGVFSKKEILLKFFSLQLFQDKFIKSSDNCSFCLLCEIEIKNSAKTVKYHLIGQSHYDTFLDFIQLNFKFTSFDLLNGFNMEEVIRWILQHNLQFNNSSFKLYDEKAVCLEVSNSSLNNLNYNYLFCFVPKIIEKALEVNVSDLIVNSSCLLCNKKDITLEHFNSKSHEKEAAKKNLENKSIFQLYLRNRQERLQPYKREIAMYEEFKEFVETLNKQDAEICDKKKTLDTTKATNRENIKNNVLNLVDDKVKKKNEITANKEKIKIKQDNIKKEENYEELKIKQDNIKKEEEYEEVTNKNNFKKEQELLNNVECTYGEKKNLPKKVRSHLVGKKKLKENVIVKMKKKNNGQIENFLIVSDLPKKVTWEEVYDRLLSIGAVEHVFFKNNKRIVFFKDSKIITNSAEWQHITIKTKKVPISVALEKDAEAILTKYVHSTMPNSVKNEEIIKLNKVDNIKQQKLNDKGNSSKKKKIINLTQEDDSKSQNIEQNNLDTDMPMKKKKGNEEPENYLIIPDIPETLRWSDVYDELLRNGAISKVRFHQKKGLVFFENAKVASELANNQSLIVRNEIIRVLLGHQEIVDEPELDTLSDREETNETILTSGCKMKMSKKLENRLNKQLHRELGKKCNILPKNFKIKYLGKLCFATEKKENEKNENFLLLKDLPKEFSLLKMITELLKFGEIASIYFKEKQTFVIVFKNLETYKILADRKYIVIDKKPIPIRFISKDQIKSFLEQATNVKDEFKSLLTKPEALLNFTMDLLTKSLSISTSTSESERNEIVCSKTLNIAFKQHQFRVKNIFCFGSRISGLSSDNSDLDILLDCDDMYALGDKWTINSQKKMAFCFANLLRTNSDFTKIECVARAKVPIVKFLEKTSNLNCDLSFKNGLSVENTKLLKFLFSLDMRVQPLILFLKFWLKCINIHGRPGFSSYAMSLMVIFYLQQLPLPILPAIETLKKNFVGRRLTLAGWDCSFSTDTSSLETTKNRDPIPKLLLGFFEFYSEFDFSKFIVSPLTGTPIPRASFSQPVLLPLAYKRHVHNIPLQRLCHTKELICVVDPFDLSHNVTDNFHKPFFIVFLEYCKLSFELMSKSTKETNCELKLDNSVLQRARKNT